MTGESEFVRGLAAWDCRLCYLPSCLCVFVCHICRLTAFYPSENGSRFVVHDKEERNVSHEATKARSREERRGEGDGESELVREFGAYRCLLSHLPSCLCVFVCPFFSPLRRRLGSGLGGHLIEEVIHESVGPRCGSGMERFCILNEARNVDTMRRELDVVTVAKPDSQGFGVNFGVELDCERSVKSKGLRRKRCRGEFARVWWQLPSVVVTLEPRAVWETVADELFNLGPSQLRLGTRSDATSEDSGHQLASETDAKNWDTGVVGRPKYLEFR